MAKDLTSEGRCWKFGDNIPTDLIPPTHVMFKTPREMDIALMMIMADVAAAGRTGEKTAARRSVSRKTKDLRTKRHVGETLC